MEGTAGLLQFERQAWASGCKRVAGVDEAGRGPLAGPVVAAAVVFSQTFIEQEEHRLFDTLTDSKQLTANQRDRFFELLVNSPEVEIGIGFGDVPEIDEINILYATYLAMRRALQGLSVSPGYALIDGNRLPPDLPCAAETIIKGDDRAVSIAAASILAKVTRDRLMRDLSGQFPGYGWETNAGYGTSQHLDALSRLGVTPHHRVSFKPVHHILYQDK